MIVALAIALAAPPAPMPIEELLAAAEVIALGEPIQVEFEAFLDGEERTTTGSYWVEYRVVEAVRGADVGDVVRVKANSYCLPTQTTARRIGDRVYPVGPDGERGEALDPTDWLGHGVESRAWLLLQAPHEGVRRPVQSTIPVTGPRADALRDALAD